MDTEQLRLAAGLIRQSPPGQVGDVLADIQAIVGDNSGFRELAIQQVAEHNLDQLTIVTLPEAAEPTILSRAAQVSGQAGTFVDPESKRSFTYDHESGQTSNEEEYNLPEADECFRAALSKSLRAYVKNHYPGGTCAVFCSARPLRKPAAAEAVPADDSETSGTATSAGAEPEKVEEQAILEAVQEKAEAGTAGSSEDTPNAAAAATSEATDHSKSAEMMNPATESAAAGEVDDAAADKEASAEAGAGSAESRSGEEAVDSADASLVKPAARVEEPVEEHVKKPDEISEDAAKEPKTPEPPIEDRTVPNSTSQSAVPAAEGAPAGPTVCTIQIVSNKYNVSNFWTGRWRSEYRINAKEPAVQGNIKVDVHYFENGNVQLAAQHTPSFDLPTSPMESASAIVTTISKLEAAYQQDLNSTFSDLGDKAFRSLRRALPITRQKVDWEKIGGYKLGGQLGGPRGEQSATA